MTLPNFVSSVIFAAVVVQVTKNAGGELLLPGLFVVVHPLSCITGLLSNQPTFNANVARAFAVCTIVGILEMSACDQVLKPIAGHVWYDLTLHAAVLASLPYFWTPQSQSA